MKNREVMKVALGMESSPMMVNRKESAQVKMKAVSKAMAFARSLVFRRIPPQM